MSFFRDLFSARRRAPRVVVNWMVDVSIPNTNPKRWNGLFATDLSTRGIRLKGLEPDEVRRLLNDDGNAQMKLRMPNFHTGWLFTEIDAPTLELIEHYIAEHPQDLIGNPA
jgi:hypothetical protein